MTQTTGLSGSNDPGIDNLVAAVRDLLETDPRAALQSAEMLLPTAPDPRVFRLAAAACRRLGMTADAEDAELAGIQAGFRVRELNDAAVAGQDGRNGEAREIVDCFLEAHPDDLLALTMAAESDVHAWQLERAGERLRTVLGRAPSFLRAIMLLAKCLMFQARLEEAIDVVQAVLQRKPNNRTALQYVAQLHAEANNHEKAAEIYGRILALDPSDFETWIVYAQHLRMLGRKDEATAAFRRALTLDSDSGAAWWNLANYFASDLTESDVESIHRALERRADRSDDGGPLHLALAILAERGKDYGETFRHVSEGKRLLSDANPYDPDVATRDVATMLGSFTPERFAAQGSSGFPDESPIFVIGMPRTGSTLLERILSCHSQIEPGGELPIMPRLHERLRHQGGSGYADDVAAMSPEELRRLGEWYIERSRDYRTSDKPKFVDKLNSNWFHIGLIRLMLPNARIIDIRRDALDCCWSNYKMLFAEGHVAANDQRHIARFYKDYVRLVAGIDEAAPGGILRVRYEDLVDDIESETRRILDFLGLEYEPACIDFHLATGAVATPSSEQVRRPINRDSIGSADPYRQWLGPMIEELGDLAR
ncbi:MAG TPA: sulfotransferase [Sphingomicrobium sp.]